MKSIFSAVKKICKMLKKACKVQGGISKKWSYIRFYCLAWKNGVVDFRLDRIATEYTIDYYDDLGISRIEKKWACEKGITPHKINWYGINEKNYKNYISDFEFYSKNNYMNRDFETWFEHKLNTYYLLTPFKEHMPTHYWYKKGVDFFPVDISVIGTSMGSAEMLIEIVKNKKIVAKAARGGHGVGFYKFECINEKYYANEIEYKKNEIVKLLNGLDDYIFEEYVEANKMFKTICGENMFAVIRVVLVYDKKDGAQLTGAIIRLGCKAAGLVTDYSGTIYCGITLDEGKMYKPVYREADNKYKACVYHPDTKNKLEGHIVPHWSELRKLCSEISTHITMTPYLVLDIIPTDKGFSILEINSHGQLRTTEQYYPCCLNEYNKRVFNIER